MSIVQGHEQALQRLQALEAGTAKKIMRPSLLEGCDVVLRMAKTIAPVKLGTMRDNLAIRKPASNRKGSIRFMVGASAGDFKGEAFYTPFVLWGHKIGSRKLGDARKSTRPNDFIHRSYEYTKLKALNAVMEGATQRIEKLTTGKSTGS